MRLLLLFSALLCLGCKPARVREGAEVFFPPELGARFAELQDFKGAWWNDVVAERPGPRLCQALRAEPDLASVGCEFSLSELAGLAMAWIQDQPLRGPPPAPAALRQQLDLALAKASVPLGSELLQWLREDPLQSAAKLEALLLALNPVQLPYENGFLRLPAGAGGVVPILFRYPRSEVARTDALRIRVERACQGECGKLHFLGSHFGTALNQDAVKSDLHRVSFLGSLLFALFLGGLALSGRFGALLLVLPVSLGVGAAAFLMERWHGGIHGLTLAFGGGLIGMAFDYAFHAFVRDAGVKIWQANFLGYLTTALVFVVLAFSRIPLVRELMEFSFLGFSLAFLLFFLLIILLPERLRLKPFGFAPWPTRAAPWLLGASLLILGAAALWLRPDLSIRSLDLGGKEERQLTEALFASGGRLPPVFRVHGAEAGEGEFARELEFAGRHGIKLVNRFTFLPAQADQERNLSLWRAASCGSWLEARRWPPAYQRFFAPFFAAIDCAALKRLQPRRSASYTESIQGEGKWLSSFFPARGEDQAALAAAFPDAFSLQALVEEFPRLLFREMAWMAPLSLALVFLLVWAVYRRWALAAAIFLPFVIGAAFAVAGMAFSPSGCGFVSLVGLLMIFGMATDYGVFCANYYLNSQLTRKGIWTALAFSGLVTLVGFLPLLFAHHPVLRQLGEPLCLGTLGTLLGVFVVQPWWMRNVV